MRMKPPKPTKLTPKPKACRTKRKTSTSAMNAKRMETVLLIWGVPKKVKAKFKEKCTHDGITMRDAILNFMNNRRMD